MKQQADPGSGCDCLGRYFFILSLSCSTISSPEMAGRAFLLSREGRFIVSMDRYLFTSESVSMGHPDKVADQISDAILDHCLRTDPTSRVACETLVTTDLVVVAGEITTRADLSRATVDRVVRDAIRAIGYVDPTIGFAADTCQVESHLHKQSGDI